MRKLIPALFVLTLLLAACAPSATNDSAVATLVAAALQTSAAGAPTEIAAAPTATAQPLYGIVSGSICYPSSGIPPMTVFFQLSGTGTFVSQNIALNQSTYQQELPPGNYTAYAWLPDFSIGGSYSNAVPCGLSASCSDHSLITFSIVAGQNTGGVDVCDWYGDSDDVPLPPGFAGDFPVGSISGQLSYPSEGIPAMYVVAFNSESQQYFYTYTNAGSSGYQIDDLPAGTYYVVAYPDLDGIGAAGGYTAAVPCGLSASCTDHALLGVQVFGGEIAVGINPQDWYAPEGAFPGNPVQ